MSVSFQATWATVMCETLEIADKLQGRFVSHYIGKTNETGDNLHER